MPKRKQNIRKNIGEILLEKGIIDRKTLDEALAIQNRRLGEILIENKFADPAKVAEALRSQALEAGQRTSTPTFRVSSDDVDEMLDLLERPGSAPTENIQSLRQRLESLLVENVESILDRARSLAKTTAQAAGKKIRLEFSNHVFFIDRSIVPDVSEILAHLIRNAIDHGADSPADRALLRKPGLPEVAVEVALAGKELLLRVRDDGHGIDFDAVSEKARQMGLLKKDRAALSGEEKKKFLFAPGLSTRNKVTGLSGRGVGLDAVESVSMRHGGKVEVHSKLGMFTEFQVTIPIRIFASDLLVVRVGETNFAFFKNYVSRVSPFSSAESGSFLSAASLWGRVDVSAPSFVIRTIDSKSWIVEEVLCSGCFVVRVLEPGETREDAEVIGISRLPDGRPFMVVDLQRLASAARPFKPL